MFNGRRQPSGGGASRMTRECQVRFCERLGVKFPGPTRQNENPSLGGLCQPRKRAQHNPKDFLKAFTHYGQRSCEPHQQAKHMAAPTCNVKKVLANSGSAMSMRILARSQHRA